LTGHHYRTRRVHEHAGIKGLAGFCPELIALSLVKLSASRARTLANMNYHSEQDWAGTLEESIKRLEERNRLARIAERRERAPYLRLVHDADDKLGEQLAPDFSSKD